MAKSKPQQPPAPHPKPGALPQNAVSTQRTNTWQVFSDFASI